MTRRQRILRRMCGEVERRKARLHERRWLAPLLKPLTGATLYLNGKPIGTITASSSELERLRNHPPPGPITLTYEWSGTMPIEEARKAGLV